MLDRRAEARVYARWKRGLFLLDIALTAALLGGLVASGLHQSVRLWVSARIPAIWPLQVAAYTTVLWLGMTAASFPLDWFGSFALEHRFNLSTQRLTEWLTDYAKHLALGSGLGLLLVEGLSLLLRSFPTTWWIWAAIFWMGWSAFLARILPTWLIPIFYKQRPLADENLRQRLASFVARCGARVEGVYEVNLSRTTRKANACLCGLGKTRRVLVSDTLLQTHPPEEVEVVLAHEVGHHQLHHIGILLGVGTAAAALSFFAVDGVSRLLFARTGVTGIADLAALPLLALGLFAANLVLMPATNGVSRLLEAQADRFALQQTQNPQAFIATMRRLADQNLSEIEPPPWVEWLLYDHPPIAKRIALAQRYGGGA